MKFTQHYSGSMGNLYVLEANNGKRLLIDPGVTWPKLQKALNWNLEGIQGCLISHSHQDHCKAVKNVIEAGIDVHASVGTLEALDLIDNRRAKPMFTNINMRANYISDDFDVYCFDAHHDAVNPFLFVIHCRSDEEFVLFATDTSHITQRFGMQFSIIMLECSYNKKILETRVEEKTINETLATRLLTSHMEESHCAAYIKDFCDLKKCREIHLLHCSGENLNKNRTVRSFRRKFYVKVVML